MSFSHDEEALRGMKDLKKDIEEHGLLGISKILDSWKDVKLSIAVTGNSGIGKSTFINAIRCLTETDELAAKTGSMETTMKATAYPHPNNENLVLYDLPGISTVKFPRENYFKDSRINFDHYDVYVIILGDRINQDDILLGKEVKKRKKPVIFIRSKMIKELENNRQTDIASFKANPKMFDINFLNEIRDYCRKGLVKTGLKLERVFLIDSKQKTHHLLEFETVVDVLLNSFEKNKRDAFILTITESSSNMLEAKKSLLQNRIYIVACISAVGGAIPIPGLSAVVDAGLIIREVKFYRQQLGLDEASLKEIAELTGTNLKDLAKDLSIESMKIEYTLKGLTSTAGAAAFFAAQNTVEAAFFTLPVIGSIFGSSTSYLTTVIILSKALKMMISDAEKVQAYVQRNTLLQLPYENPRQTDVPIKRSQFCDMMCQTEDTVTEKLKETVYGSIFYALHIMFLVLLMFIGYTQRGKRNFCSKCKSAPLNIQTRFENSKETIRSFIQVTSDSWNPKEAIRSFGQATEDLWDHWTFYIRVICIALWSFVNPFY